MKNLSGQHTDGIGDYHTYSVTAYIEDYHFVFSKEAVITTHFVDGDSFPESDTVMVKMTCGGTSYEEKHEADSAGDATFNIARFLQILTSETRMYQDYNNTDSEPKGDVEFAIEIKKEYVPGIWEKVCEFSFVGTNGAMNLNESYFAEEKRLRRFNGYPFTFDFININGNWDVSINGAAAESVEFFYQPTSLDYSFARINIYSIVNNPNRLRVSTDSGIKVVNNRLTSGVNNSVYVETVNDTKPFGKVAYLRWIDRQGELRYWLFDRHEESTVIKADDVEMSSPMESVFDDYDVQHSRTRHIFDNTDEMTIFSGILNKNYYDQVITLANSPVVEMLVHKSTSAPKWSRVSVKAASYKSRTRYMGDSNFNAQLVFTLSVEPKTHVRQ